MTSDDPNNGCEGDYRGSCWRETAFLQINMALQHGDYVKNKKTLAANENAYNAGNMKSTCFLHQATILKAHRKIRGGAGRKREKYFFLPSPYSILNLSSPL